MKLFHVSIFSVSLPVTWKSHRNVRLCQKRFTCHDVIANTKWVTRIREIVCLQWIISATHFNHQHSYQFHVVTWACTKIQTISQVKVHKQTSHRHQYQQYWKPIKERKIMVNFIWILHIFNINGIPWIDIIQGHGVRTYTLNCFQSCNGDSNFQGHKWHRLCAFHLASPDWVLFFPQGFALTHRPVFSCRQQHPLYSGNKILVMCLTTQIT